MENLPLPLITNERARQEWEYIVAHVGEAAAREAINRIPGKRKPYPLNVANILGIKIPKEIATQAQTQTQAAPPEMVKEYLAKIRDMLSALPRSDRN